MKHAVALAESILAPKHVSQKVHGHYTPQLEQMAKAVLEVSNTDVAKLKKDHAELTKAHAELQKDHEKLNKLYLASESRVKALSKDA